LLIEDGHAFEYYGEKKRDMAQMETLQLLLDKRGYSSWEEYSEANP